ncbi:MAG: hypothetical protein J6C86_08270 [Bacteroidaceae bacterium]|nr:hypothetical protein [Bacteroidaceae bacterium]
MANTTTLSSQQLIVTVEDASIINELKRAIKMMRGVSKISVRKPKKTEIELAREEAQTGKVTKWENVDDLFNEILGE